jgi:hypothetical protein
MTTVFRLQTPNNSNSATVPPRQVRNFLETMVLLRQQPIFIWKARPLGKRAKVLRKLVHLPEVTGGNPMSTLLLNNFNHGAAPGGAFALHDNMGSSPMV